MTCFHPLEGYKSRRVSVNGKRGIVFSVRKGYVDLPMKVPCGQCVGCRMDYSKMWAIRCIHEAKMNDQNNMFITLTYNNQNLPKYGSLVLKDLQKFIKRMRAYIYPTKMRYYACGEYGEKKSRPHYHVLIFGYVFDDLEKMCISGKTVFVSKKLSNLWKYGYSTVGEVNYDSASYTARYILKKQNGELAKSTYRYGQIKEFTVMSTKPGIGKMYYENNKEDFYSLDSIVLKGYKAKIPRYYDNMYDIEYPEKMKEIKKERVKKCRRYTEKELMTKKKSLQLMLKTKERVIHNENI